MIGTLTKALTDRERGEALRWYIERGERFPRIELDEETYDCSLAPEQEPRPVLFPYTPFTLICRGKRAALKNGFWQPSQACAFEFRGDLSCERIDFHNTSPRNQQSCLIGCALNNVPKNALVDAKGQRVLPPERPLVARLATGQMFATNWGLYLAAEIDGHSVHVDDYWIWSGRHLVDLYRSHSGASQFVIITRSKLTGAPHLSQFISLPGNAAYQVIGFTVKGGKLVTEDCVINLVGAPASETPVPIERVVATTNVYDSKASSQCKVEHKNLITRVDAAGAGVAWDFEWEAGRGTIDIDGWLGSSKLGDVLCAPGSIAGIGKRNRCRTLEPSPKRDPTEGDHS